MSVDARVPGYLGRVLDDAGAVVGTCFQVASGVLVTAWHVLDALGAGQPGASVAVDALNGAVGSAPADVVSVDTVHDLAVLRRVAPLPASVTGLVVTDGVALGTEVVVTGISKVDDPEHDYRYLDAAGNWTGGTTRDDQVPLGRLTSTSVMPGMSGAPVRRVVDDVVVGVVSGRYNSADQWLRDSVWVARTEHLPPLLDELALGIPVTRLWRLPEADRRDSPYTATIRDLIRRTPVLLDRDLELSKLSAFATGQEGYRWLKASPWAGKTALLAHFYQLCPPDVDVIAYFLMRRISDSDVSRFCSMTVSQLAPLVGRARKIPNSHRVETFRHYWEQAVQRAEASNRHLVLIVDGLDEDTGPINGLASIASALPSNVGGRAHVLISSRRKYDLPDDLDLDHPLKRVEAVNLMPSPHATSLSERAMQELKQSLRPLHQSSQIHSQVRTVRAVITLAAAAEGPLTLGDMSGVLGAEVDSYDIESTLMGEANRLFQSISGATGRLFFAHDTLFEEAKNLCDPRHLETYRQKVYDWAATYFGKKWTSGDVPIYLFDSYPMLLVKYFPQRLTPLLEDPSYLLGAAATLNESDLKHLLDEAVHSLSHIDGVATSRRIAHLAHDTVSFSNAAWLHARFACTQITRYRGECGKCNEVRERPCREVDDNVRCPCCGAVSIVHGRHDLGLASFYNYYYSWCLSCFWNSSWIDWSSCDDSWSEFSPTIASYRSRDDQFEASLLCRSKHRRF